MIVIEHIAGIATIQDLGRPGFMHEGLAPGGALVPELLIGANRLAGNEDNAPALEVFGRLRMRVEGRVIAGDRIVDERGDLQIESGRLRVIYVAIPGGIVAPLICGGRGTQLSAGIGAALRAGDQLVPGTHAIEQRRIQLPGFALDPAPIRVLPGPDDGLDALLAGDFTISPASNRVGTRLAGAALPARSGSGVSRPMIRGAIELPPDGHPIVLGPEHPTTGGYPVIGVLSAAEQSRLFARPIGARVRFTPSGDAAR